MIPVSNEENPACRSVQALLSDYLDSKLPVRQAWEIEKHLASCPECARLSHDLKMTVQILRSAKRFDTSEDFMARLHARLDAVEAQAAPAAGWSLRVWITSVGQALRAPRVPALSMCAVFAAIALLLVTNHASYEPQRSAPASGISRVAPETLRRHVAESTTDPLEDLAAVNLGRLLLEDARSGPEAD